MDDSFLMGEADDVGDLSNKVKSLIDAQLA